MGCPEYIIKVDDQLPILSATLTDQDGNPSDLTGFTSMQLRYRPAAGGAVQTKTATIDDALNGKVSYAWTSGDTSTAGLYYGEWVGTGPSAKPQTWPTSGYFEFKIEEHL